MIGIFDSGLGGLQTLKYFQDLYPEYDYLYLADTKNNPYGDKSSTDIKNHTFAALQWLFEQWADVVIVACNTAAAYAIRAWQSEFPDKKALSVTIPAVEKVIKLWAKDVGVLMTEATLRSGVFHDLYARLWWDRHAVLEVVMAPEIVPLIESWDQDRAHHRQLIKKYLSKFNPFMDCLVLWCTHYPIWMEDFMKLFSWTIVDPSMEACRSFGEYLLRHPEIASQLSKKSQVQAFCTWDVKQFEQIAQAIYGDEIPVKQVEID